MTDAYIRARKLVYTYNFFRRFASTRMLANRFYRVEGLFASTLGVRQTETLLQRMETAEETPAARQRLLGEIQQAFARCLARRGQVPARGSFARNLRLIANVLGLRASEQAVLECLLSIANEEDLGDCLEALDNLTYTMFISLLAGLTGLRPSTVRQALAPGAILLTSGLVTIDHTPGRSARHKYELASRLAAAVNGPAHSETSLLECFCRQSPAPAVTPADFHAQHAELADLISILRTALRHRKQGINLLLYGPPGVGKTEFARLVAAQVQAHLYDVPSAEADGSPATPRSRVTALTLAQRLLQNHRQLLLVMDDADDILNHGSGLFGSGGEVPLSKDWLNRTLEGNAVPTVWIVNDEDGMDEAHKRRFTTSVRFQAPDSATRKRLWQTVLRRHGVESGFEDPALEGLARRYDVSVGLIDKAMSTARMMHPRGQVELPALERLLQRAIVLRDGQSAPPMSAASPCQQDAPYELGLLNTSPAISDVVRGVQRFVDLPPAARPAPGLCLLFHGLPGTGKTAFADHLARTFQQAQQEHAVLLIDECDSFLQQRANAQRSWEVTQVNELLTQIDAFAGKYDNARPDPAAIACAGLVPGWSRSHPST